MRRKKTIDGIKYYVVISLVSVLAVGSIMYAYSGGTPSTVIENQVVQGDYVSSGGTGIISDGEFTPGAFPGTDITVDNLTYGTSHSGPLNFSAGATTTAGGLFSIFNFSARRICTRVEVDVTTVLQGSLGFSVATSTAKNAISNDTIGLIGTTTMVTSTGNLIDSAANAGTYSSKAGSFEWNRGEYIIGQFDAAEDASTATSSDYTSAAGKFYITCHEV